jgi:hypothetical protein
LRARTLRRFDGSPKVVDATYQDIDDQCSRVLLRGPDSKANRGPDGRGIRADRQCKKIPERVEPHPTRTNSFPKFRPDSIPMNASGAASRPSTISSR